MARIGAIFTPDHPPEELREAVIAAEEAGVSELWVWEDCFRESAFAAVGASLAWTERLRIGIGIAPMPLRNVAVTAMEIATLERMFPGRLLPGVGHGVLSWMGQVGARVSSPLTLMREYVPALRALLAGDEVTVSGRYVTLDRVRLDWPPAIAPPVYAAGEGPKTLALTGEVADGTVLVTGSPDRIAEQARIARAGRADAGRGGPHDVVAYVAWDRAMDAGATARTYIEAGADAAVFQPGEGNADLAGFYAAIGAATREIQASG